MTPYQTIATIALLIAVALYFEGWIARLDGKSPFWWWVLALALGTAVILVGALVEP